MWKQVLVIAALLLSACGAAGGGGRSGLLQVDQVDVRVAESFPPQIFVQVKGTLPDGCTSLGEISQRREGNTITVTITTEHSGAEVCTQIAQLVDETIRLDGTFTPGEYTVRVNGVERTFRI